MTVQNLPKNDKRVLSLIKTGAENAITGAEIASVSGLDKRLVQKIISRLITKYGVPIVGVRSGSNRGYFIPANKAELMDGTRAFYNQLQDEQKRLTILVNADPAIYTELIKELLEGV